MIDRVDRLLCILVWLVARNQEARASWALALILAASSISLYVLERRSEITPPRKHGPRCRTATTHFSSLGEMNSHQSFAAHALLHSIQKTI